MRCRRRPRALLAMIALAGGACDRDGSSSRSSLYVVDLSPDAGSEEVDPDLTLVVTMSAALDPESVGPGSIEVSTPEGAVEGEISLTDGDTALRFVADTPVGRFVPVSVSVDGRLRGAKGQRMARDYDYSFRTLGLELVLDRASAEGLIGTERVVQAKMRGDAGLETVDEVTWSSADATVATVAGSSAGTIVFVGVGTTTVTAEGYGFEASIPVAAATTTGGGILYLGTDSTWTDKTVDPYRELPKTWDLRCDGSITDGGADEFDGPTWVPVIDPLTSAVAFPCLPPESISFGEPLAVLPTLRLETVGDWNGYVGEGTSSCHLRPIGRVSMHQAIAIPSNATALTLSWADYVYLLDDVNAVPDYATESAWYRVTVENLTDATAPAIVYAVASTDGVMASDVAGVFDPRSFPLDAAALAGKTVRLTFEAFGGGYEGAEHSEAPTSGVFVDSVKLIDQLLVDHVDNGGCEQDLDDWTGQQLLVSREVNFGPVTVGTSLRMTRSVHAPAAGGDWIRYLDTVTNPAGIAATFTLRMEGDLGSDGSGIVSTSGTIQFNVDDFNPALHPPAGANPDPMVAMIPGAPSRIDVASPGEWAAEYDLTLGPGQAKSILAIHVIGDSNDAADLPLLETRAEQIRDSILLLGLDSPYAAGLTEEEWATVVNW